MFKEEYAKLKSKAESALREFFGSGGFERLEKGMEYSLFAGGKRLRPVIILHLCQTFGVQDNLSRAFASAIEMIHTYSLIHDDLPAMDGDTLRRGKPTNHMVFGEGDAILNGDALLNLAFETLLNNVEKKEDIKAARYLAKASGRLGMCSGQSADLFFEGKEVSDKELSYINKNKTGALIKACFVVPAILANKDISIWEEIGDKFGVLFQLTDDYLDVFGLKENLGKSIGKDEKSHKATVMTVLGKENCLNKIDTLKIEIISLLLKLVDNKFLIDLTESTATRIS